MKREAEFASSSARGAANQIFPKGPEDWDPAEER